MNAAYISALAALAGSAIGGLASFATSWLTQHHQEHSARLAQEAARRERLFGEFIDEASRTFADAMVSTLDEPSKIVHLYAIIGKLRLFASEETIEAAQAVMLRVLETYATPVEISRIPPKGADERLDLLRDFTEASRRELRG